MVVRNDGKVRVYSLNDEAGSWDQIENPIDPAFASNNYLDYRLALSAHEDIIVIGDEKYDLSRGRVQVYALHPDNDWTRLEDPIVTVNQGDYSGQAINFSAYGTTLTIGAHFNDGNGSSCGHLRPYEYNITDSSWAQSGQDIDGEVSRDESGRSVLMSKDGSVLYCLLLVNVASQTVLLTLKPVLTHDVSYKLIVMDLFVCKHR